MKNLNVEDFSYKGHKSAIQSVDTQFFEDLGFGGGLFMNNNATAPTDDRMSISSDPFGINVREQTG